ncbi:hypothetical protein HMPREF1589_04908 [Escherichia coli 113290]|nr:hypothetical protein HMPREF1589_04908 [Escherichia coli 113290]
MLFSLHASLQKLYEINIASGYYSKFLEDVIGVNYHGCEYIYVAY